MLTKRENFMEVIRGGNPDRFANQYDALGIIMVNPMVVNSPYPFKPGETCVDAWGVTHTFEPGTPGAFPVHTNGLRVLEDITEWREKVKAPNVFYPDGMWAGMKAQFVDTIDTKEQIPTLFFPAGLFERTHYLLGIEDTLCAFYEEPEEMHALLDYLTDWEVAYAEQVCAHYPIEAVLHHDDWGTQVNSFFSPAMFEEFFVPRYKRIYDTYRKHGVKLIIHHSDCYCANLIPHMIEMGIDVWQGCLTVNNLPELIKQYGGKISFMGGIDNGIVDRVDWTDEKIEAYVRDICGQCGKNYFIPCMCAGMPVSAFPGVYESVSKAIDKLNQE